MRILIATLAVLVSGAVVFADAGKVRVEPFTEANEKQQPDWINRALQQSVVDDLSSITGMEVVREDQQNAEQNADARYVITGSIQRVESSLRVTGRIEDKSMGKIIGSFKATGGERDLFAMEDAIAEQLRQTFAPAPTPAPTNVPPATLVAANQPPQAPPAVTRTSFDGSDLQRALDERDYLRRLAERRREIYDQPTTPYTYTVPLYPYTYGLGGYYYPPYWTGGWGWGGWPGSIIIKSGHGGHHGAGGGSFNGGSSGSFNGQAIRQAASFAGNPPSIVTHTMNGGPIMTMGPTPAR